MAIAQFVPLMAQMTGIHIGKWKCSKDDLKWYIPQQIKYSKQSKFLIVIVFMCGFSTCATYGTER